MWKLSQPFLPGIASRNRSNNNSFFFTGANVSHQQHSAAEATHLAIHPVVTTLRYLFLRF